MMLELMMGVVVMAALAVTYYRWKLGVAEKRIEMLRVNLAETKRVLESNNSQIVLLQKQLTERTQKVEEAVEDAEDNNFNHFYTSDS